MYRGWNKIYCSKSSGVGTPQMQIHEANGIWEYCPANKATGMAGNQFVVKAILRL